MDEIHDTVHHVVDLAHENNVIPLFTPTYKKLPKLTEKDFQEIENCRYIRKSRRQFREKKVSFSDISFLRNPEIGVDGVAYVYNNEHKEKTANNNRVHSAKIPAEQTTLENQEERTQFDGVLQRLVITPSETFSQGVATPTETISQRSITPLESIVETKESATPPKLKSKSCELKSPQFYGPPIKPLVPVVSISADMRSYLLPGNTTSSVRKSPLNRRKVDQLRSDFVGKCTISTKQSSMKTTTRTASRNSNNIERNTAVNNNNDNAEILVPKIKAKLPSMKTQVLYKEILSASKRLDLSIGDIVRDVKQQRGLVDVTSAIQARKKGHQKWALLAKMVRSGLLCRKDSRVLRIIKKQRSARKAVGGRYSTARSALIQPPPPRINSVINLRRLMELHEFGSAGKFGAPRKILLGTRTSLPIFSTELPMILPSHVLDQVFPAAYTTNRRGSSFI